VHKNEQLFYFLAVFFIELNLKQGPVWNRVLERVVVPTVIGEQAATSRMFVSVNLGQE
jgi:hypothetical protein